MNAEEVREAAAALVRKHAARLGMDQLAANILVGAIEALPADREIHLLPPHAERTVVEIQTHGGPTRIKGIVEAP